MTKLRSSLVSWYHNQDDPVQTTLEHRFCAKAQSIAHCGRVILTNWNLFRFP